MTHRIRPNTGITTRALLGVAVIGTLLLAGCTSSGGGPTPSPTSSATAGGPSADPSPSASGVDAPESEEDAVTAAEAVIERYIALSDLIASEGGQEADRITEVAIEPALSGALESAKAIADNKYVVTGESEFAPESSYATDIESTGTTIPFGSVTVTGCFDTSNRPIKNADGSDAPQPPNLSSPREVNVVYVPEQKAWFVRTFLKTSDDPC